MFRGETARSATPVLVALLIALQFFAPTASFATAHTASHAEAKGGPGSELSGPPPRVESLTPRSCDPPVEPTGPLRPRDRTGPSGCASPTCERPLPPEDSTSVPGPAAPGGAHHRAARSSSAHTPAALQVFRC
ncbi:hypothetical protein [Streptomyces sp. NPDC048002]|uniref:hypothetical protein n=1 Tax=Streptomyces sp. NPDC048002 TaxID=3154344 RepID=UPI0033EFD4A8